VNAARLYTTELLAAAVDLANWPALENAPLHGSARAPACGSTLAMDVALGTDGRIARIGLGSRACAVGQAAATVFARHAAGLGLAEVQAAHDGIIAWLDGAGPAPDWPDLALIAPAREYRARHGAMLLPWKAALDALSKAGEGG
jgi:NifU-like protein involved in Fe-S cluster formation